MPLLAGFLGGQSCLPLSWCHLLVPPMQQGQFLQHNSILISWHRSHFGSRYTSGCCSHASLSFVAQVRFPLLSLFFNSRASCAQLLLGFFLPSSTFGSCHRGCPIRPSLQHSMPSTECHSLLDLLVANRACPYQGVICCCFQCSKDNFCSTIQF